MSPHKPSSRNQEKRILISSPAASLYQFVELQQGIRRFARTRSAWNIGWIRVENSSDRDVQEALNWKPHGVVVLERPALVPTVMAARETAMTVVDLHHDHLTGVSRVEIDDREIGREVARDFLRNRFEHFGVVVWPGDPPFSAYRAEGYCHEVREAGWSAERFEVKTITEQPWHHHPEFDAWLSRLPKPVALYAVQNQLAQRVVHGCKRLGIQIPIEVSIVGMDALDDNDERKRPFISFLQQPLEEAGFRVAELLDQHLQVLEQGGKPDVCSIQIKPGAVVERQSSSLRAISDPNVAKAAQYLWEHALGDGTIADAVRASGVNRRSLERGFRRHLGVSPGQFIRERKMEHAKKLLTETDLRVWEIAEACALTQEHFITVFRETVGITPDRYRRSQRRGTLTGAHRQVLK